MPIGIAVARDPECRWIDGNPYLARLLGIPAGDQRLVQPPRGRDARRRDPPRRPAPPRRRDAHAARDRHRPGGRWTWRWRWCATGGAWPPSWATRRRSSTRPAGRAAPSAPSLDITERKRAEEQIRSLAYHDSLTGLPNRLLFSDRLRGGGGPGPPPRDSAWPCCSWTWTASRSSTTRSGHSVGDRLIAEVATAPAHVRARGRHRGPAGRRRVHAAAARASTRSVDAAKVAEKVLEALRAPVPARRPRAVRHRQHRHQPLSRGRPGRGDAAQERGHRDVPGQGAGARPLPALHPRHERDRPGAAGPGEQPAQGPGPGRAACCTTSRSSTWPAAACTASRRCCAGGTRSWGWSPPRSSCPWRS